MWLGLWALAFPFGTMTGAVTGAWIQDRTGRKSTLGLGCLLSLGAITIAYLSDQTTNPTSTYWAAKFTQGIAVGVLMASTQTYLSEVVPARLRGPIMALFPAFQLLGQLIAAVVILARGSVKGPMSYRIAIASEFPLSVIPLVLAVILPESPVWLLRKGKLAAAQNSFRRLHGATVAAAHQDLFEEMNRAISEEKWASNDRGASYIECFRGTNLRRTMIVVFSNGMSEIMGFNVLGSVSYFLQLLGLGDMPSLIVAVIGIILGLSANVGSFWTLLKFGRRPLILYTLGPTGILWASLGIAGCFNGIAVAW
jgi:MFS family permease